MAKAQSPRRRPLNQLVSCIINFYYHICFCSYLVHLPHLHFICIPKKKTWKLLKSFQFSAVSDFKIPFTWRFCLR